MTKDEFMDIMGGIDEALIGSALDISRTDAVEVTYERPAVLRYIMGFAACIVILVTVIAVRSFSGVSRQPNTSEDANSSAPNEPDFIRGWDPEELVYNEFDGLLCIGANARIPVAELDGITAELILHNIKKEAGTKLVNELTDFEYTDCIGAEDIVLYVHDERGRRFVVTSVTPHSYNDMELISVNCLFDDCTRLYKTESGGKSEYVLMQYVDYNSERSALIACFYTLDLDKQTRRDENGIYDGSDWRVGVVGNRRIGGWQYGYQASKEFEYVGGAKFRDLIHGYEMLWNGYGKVVYPNEMPEGYADIDFNNITGWDPDKLEITENMFPGDSAIVAARAAGGITASLIFHDIIKSPGRHFIYSEDKYLDMWAADDICLYITDTEGHRVLSRIPTPLTDGSVQFLPSSFLLLGNIIEIVPTDGGNYSIMMCLTEENGVPQAIFIDCDLERYAADSPKDENGISLCGSLQIAAGDDLYNDMVYPYTEEASFSSDVSANDGTLEVFYEEVYADIR